jgi:hypothetical protein
MAKTLDQKCLSSIIRSDEHHGEAVYLPPPLSADFIESQIGSWRSASEKPPTRMWEAAKYGIG